MRDTNGVTLSVRGEAAVTVPADYAVLFAGLLSEAESKAASLALVANAQARLIDALTALGGQPLTADSGRTSLTWSAHSQRTQEMYDNGKNRSGRISAYVSVNIVIRGGELLADLGAALAGIPELNLHNVAWEVDEDNAQWPVVRAAAIHAAIAKGRDYAAALGGSVERIEHIADVGLLGADAGGGGAQTFSLHRAARLDAAGGDAPSLDPVPQELRAMIEARLVASIAPLGQHG